MSINNAIAILGSVCENQTSIAFATDIIQTTSNAIALGLLLVQKYCDRFLKTLAIKMRENKQESEINVVRELEDHEKTRNRNSYRKVELFEPPKNLDPLWIGVSSVIKIERIGTRGNEPYQSISYYLLRTHGFDSIKGAISEMSHHLGYILTFCA